MSPIRRHLLVFARLPRLGAGKRRLARDIGAVAAVGFQRKILAETIRSLGRDPRWQTRLAVTPARSGPWPPGIPRIAQPGGDLGARMAGVARIPPPGPVVLIGSDIPGIAPHHIEAAFRALGDHDLVFGPAVDGGFWLVGWKRFPRFVDPFAGVRWSSPYTLADVLGNLRGERVAFIETRADVDDGAAFMKYARELTKGLSC